jgi:predicted nucleic acid-binding Zn ribbon protein
MARTVTVMDHVSLVLSKVLRKRGLGVHADAALVSHVAAAWLCEQFPRSGKSFTVQSFKDGVLVVGCPHSVAAQECQGAGHRLLDFLRQEMPKTVFEAVRIVRADPPKP